MVANCSRCLKRETALFPAPVGKATPGCVVDALGVPVDGKGGAAIRSSAVERGKTKITYRQRTQQNPRREAETLACHKSTIQGKTSQMNEDHRASVYPLNQSILLCQYLHRFETSC